MRFAPALVVLVACSGPRKPSSPTLLAPIGSPREAGVMGKLGNLELEAGVFDVTSVSVDLEALNAPSLDLVLGKQRVQASQLRIERRSPGDYSWFGRIDPDGFVVLVVENGEVTGSIDTGTEQYQVFTVGGSHILIRRDWNRVPPDHPPGFVAVQARAGGLPSAPFPPSDETTTVRLIVVYTTAVRDKRSNIDALIQLAVDEANTVNDRSGVSIHFELVDRYLDEVYQESPNFENNLTRFADKTDQHLPAVHARRDTSHADIALLVLDGGNNTYLGMASEIMAHEDTAFAVVDYRYLNAPYFTFEHEIGHLMGLRHDPAADSKATPYPDGHGHAADNWRTVMAILCNQTRCLRKANWSNPDKEIDGVSTGMPGVSDSATVLGKTAPTVSEFRTDPP